MTMPNFLIIGAAKCGTDSLYSYLGQHPQIYTSINKEPMFFSVEGQDEISYCGPGDREVIERFNSWITTVEQYRELFADVSDEKAVGEASTWYLYGEHVPTRIQHYIPDCKLIVILRNPVDRAYSAYTMLMRDGRETIRDFSQALAAEDKRVRANWEPMWHYRRMGLYYHQLKRYYETFDTSNIHVVMYDDFADMPVDTMQELFRFLEVDARFTPNVSERRNISFIPRYPTYHSLIVGQHPLKTALKSILPGQFRRRIKAGLPGQHFVRPAPISPVIRHQLVTIFRPDILQLQELLGRDLSQWLRTER